MKRRQFMGTLAAASVASTAVSRKTEGSESVDWDFIIIGAGTAGLPAAIFASRRGASVLLIDAADSVGGTLHMANGQVAAAGSRAQDSKGIIDTPEAHYEDVMRVTRGLADPEVVRRTVDEAPDTINWLLDNGLTPLPDHPVTGSDPGRPTYTTARYIWGKNNGRDILAVVLKELQPELDSGRVVTQLETEVTELITSESGAVVGVKARSSEGEHTFRGRHILITTGGYAMSPEVFERMVGEPAYAAGAYPTNLGKGLELATSVGGVLRGHELHRAGTGSILTDDEFPAKSYGRFNTDPLQRPPWEIWVNNQGQRFVREDEPFAETRASALVKQDKFRYAIVFDDQILRSAPSGLASWTDEEYHAHFNDHPMFFKADTLKELAEKAGIDSDELAKTVARYNESVSSGSDHLGREYMPREIVSGPYYAIIHLGSSATSSVGIVVDKDMRVLKKDGSPILNLYATGEVLGSGSTLGHVFTPGMMLTPALSIGRWLGMTLPV
ncbi:MAG: FAD-dependent oxidoreductase [Rhodospirillaceae bacterium]|nr:FAD-dependent oxidoreductase [Rhodospirillaceae bacterium]